MNHPNREALLDFLDQELTPERQTEILGHLTGCAVCRAQVESWRAVRSELAVWQIADKPLASTRPQPRQFAEPPWMFLKLAAAAVVMISVGFGLARWSAPAPVVDTAALRSAVVRELREELRAELTRFASDQSLRQQEYQAALTKTLGRLEAQRLVDYASLRKDVETVAVHAEDGFQTTRQNLVRLAGYER